MNGYELAIAIGSIVVGGYLIRKYIQYTYEEGIKAGFKMHTGVMRGQSVDEVKEKYDRYKKGAPN